VILVILLLSLKAAFGKAGGFSLTNFLIPKNGVITNVATLVFNNNENLTKMQGYTDDRINILLLGIGGPGHDGAYLSDTIILASIKPSTNDVALISIPRDLQVKSEFGITKINAISGNNEYKYKTEGVEKTRQFFEKQFNISIPYYVRVNFQAFSDAVNAVGGITVDVPRKLEDYEYPNDNGKEDKQNGPYCAGEDASSPCRFLHIKFDTGTQDMNGERALIYARSRHGTDGDDYGRSARQQLIMLALKDKVLSAGTLTNPFKIKDLYSSITNNVSTNLTLEQLAALGNFSQKVDHTRIRNLVLEQPGLGFVANCTSCDAAYVIPTTGNFDQINKAIQYIFEPSAQAFLDKQKKNNPIPATPSSTAASSSTLSSSIKIEVQNGTWQAGLAAQAKKQIETKGFSVASINNSLKRPLDSTVIYILNSKIKSEQLSSLAQTLNAQVSTTLPDWIKTTSSTPAFQTGTEVLIIIGNNYKAN
jgi:LCP family protein required for cell wall assembly